jgi:hypothetical protein
VRFHFLVTEGVVDGAGIFHKMPLIDDSRLAELFAREVLAHYGREELLSPEWAGEEGSRLARHQLITS